MRRRTFLSVTGATLFAGCSSDSEDVETVAGDQSASSGDSPTETDTKTDEPESEKQAESTDEPAGEPIVEILDHELVVDEGEFSTDVYVAATVENTGDAPSGTVELSVDWYDGNDDYLDESSQYLQSLGAGETWAARVYHLGTGAEDVESHEISGEFDTDPVTFDPDGIELVDHEMAVGEDEAVIEGRVENTSNGEVSYVQAIGKVYDGDGVVIGDQWTNVTDLPDGETWSFEVNWRGRGRTEDAADHEVLVADSAF